MTEFAIQDVDVERLERFATAFHRLYNDKGPDASLDWNEVQVVRNLAIDALGQPAREFMALADPANPEHHDDLKITCPADACSEIKAAAALVNCYRHPELIVSSELDDAYSTLASSDMEHSPSP